MSLKCRKATAWASSSWFVAAWNSCRSRWQAFARANLSFAPDGICRVATLFIEVDDFADTVARLAGYPIAMPEWTTFYGMREIGVFEPSGNIAVFAVKV